MSWKSFAEWREEAGHYLSEAGPRISTDTHETEDQARAVCEILQRDGFGGLGKIFPKRTWVEEVAESGTRGARPSDESKLKFTTQQIEEATSAVYQAIRQLRCCHGDYEPRWEIAPVDAKEMCRRLMEDCLRDPELSGERMHAEWCQQWFAKGWTVGTEVNCDAKTHPRLVSFEELSAVQRMEYRFFECVALAFRQEAEMQARTPFKLQS